MHFNTLGKFIDLSFKFSRIEDKFSSKKFWNIIFCVGGEIQESHSVNDYLINTLTLSL